VALNIATGMHHVRENGSDKLKCGKALPKEVCYFETLPVNARMCSWCF